MKKYVLALDQGTTSSRSVLFDRNGELVDMEQAEFTQYFPGPGWVEHDAVEIWQSQLATIKKLITRRGVKAEDIIAVGITNQRETAVVWERSTGKPVCPAIVWQDRRTSAFCDSLKANGAEKIIKEKTGLVVDSYFSAPKIKWILDNIPGAREKARHGDLCFGNIDAWLLYNLTHGKVHATDASNASRTMLCNIRTLQWDSELLHLFDIPESILPDIRSSSEIYGTTDVIDGSVNVPIAGIAGDQQAALFGQMCIHPGMVKNTYGTGCFMLMNTGHSLVTSKNNLLTTVAWNLKGEITYALEGSVFVAGAAVQWLRDGLGLIKSSSGIESLAGSVPSSGGVYFVPAFTGLGAPHWNQNARGTITGLTRGSTAAHIARAALESIAFQTMDVLAAMKADSGLTISEMRVDGGAAVNNLLMQFQSDIINTGVIRPMVTETTALGAAYLAGLATGFWNSVADLDNHWKAERHFCPAMTEEIRTELRTGWSKAINATISMTV